MRYRATACATRIETERGVLGRFLFSFRGTGAPIVRFVRRSVVSLLTVIAALAGIASSAYATKYFDSFFGAIGIGATAVGGLVAVTSRDIAVNDPYVDDGNAGALDGWLTLSFAVITELSV
jgi:hypothetical protein